MKKKSNSIFAIITILLGTSFVISLIAAAYLYGKKSGEKAQPVQEEISDEAPEDLIYKNGEDRSQPAYFKTTKEQWQRRVIRINFEEPYTNLTRNYFYSMLLPPDMTIKEEKENDISYISYRATDGYEYSIYPTGYLLNYLEDMAEDIKEFKDSEIKLGNYTWTLKTALLYDGSLIWYMFAAGDGTEHGFTINIPQKDREKYIKVIKDIIASFKFEQDCTKQRCN